MIKNNKNVLRYSFGKGSLSKLDKLLKDLESGHSDYHLYFIDHFFKNHELLRRLPVREGKDIIFFVDTSHEPTTTLINEFKAQLAETRKEKPIAVIGIGGGATMDTAKAVSNLLTNTGKAENYQGWDLVKVPGVYKIGIPTLSGTGAETSRTCVMINPDNGLKLGMNSDYTIFNQLILDPELTRSVPLDQYFYTAMDSYIHCLESLAGVYRNAIGDAFAQQTVTLCKEVFLSANMKTDENREKVMVASYLGGCAIANSFVGVVHPFSAGLSVTLGIHHCMANCIVMSGMEEFYPREYELFNRMVEAQNVYLPQGVCVNLTEEQHEMLFQSTIIHEKPLENALGGEFKSFLTKGKVREIFERM